mmetsp:Transcript_50590/g.69317  ORF Transcript_50590/g.69317 Transcript_50590/m.69317 type:complete len:240 (-) Transcript_50590:923-1642(-)
MVCSQHAMPSSPGSPLGVCARHGTGLGLGSELRRGGGARLHALDVLDVLRREVARGAAAGDAAEDNAVQERVATQAVAAVDAASRLAGAVEAAHNALARTHALGRVVDLQAAHGVVDRRGHDGHVEGIAGLQGQVRVELLAPLVPGLAATIGLIGAVLQVLGLLICKPVVLLEGGLDIGQRHAVLLGELLHVLVRLHDAPALVVLAVPCDFTRGLAVQRKKPAQLPCTTPLFSHIMPVT